MVNKVPFVRRNGRIVRTELLDSESIYAEIMEENCSYTITLGTDDLVMGEYEIGSRRELRRLEMAAVFLSIGSLTEDNLDEYIAGDDGVLSNK